MRTKEGINNRRLKVTWCYIIYVPSSLNLQYYSYFWGPESKECVRNPFMTYRILGVSHKQQYSTARIRLDSCSRMFWSKSDQNICHKFQSPMHGLFVYCFSHSAVPFHSSIWRKIQFLGARIPLLQQGNPLEGANPTVPPLFQLTTVVPCSYAKKISMQEFIFLVFLNAILMWLSHLLLP